MKKTAVLVVAAVAMFATACKNNKETGNGGKSDSGNTSKVSDFKMSPEAEHDLKVYRKALYMGDPYTAVTALSSYLQYDSLNVAYKDTLLRLYIELQQPKAAFLLSEEILKITPNDTDALNLNIGLAESIGALDRSVDNAKKLSDFHPNDLFYKSVYGQALLMNQASAVEGEKVLLEIINNPNSATETSPTTMVENGKMIQKEIKIRTKCLFLLATSYANASDYDKAEQYYRQILASDSKFSPAAEAILQIKKMRR